MKNIFKKITSILLIILTCFTCGNIKNVEAESGYTLTENKYFYDLFDITPLSPYHVGFLNMTDPNGRTSAAFCIEPDVLTHNGDVYDGKFYSANDSVAQLIMNFELNYGRTELGSSEASYYAAQLAVWGRIKNYDPSRLVKRQNLTTEQSLLADKIQRLATTLYNDHTVFEHGLNFKYNNENPTNSYALNDGKYSLFYLNGEWYYRSKEISLTTYGTAGKLSFNVSVDDGAYVTESLENFLEKKETSLTLGGKGRNNTFYVLVPADNNAGEFNVKINANYEYLSIMTWDFASGRFGFGQRMMSPRIASENKEYSIKFTKKAIPQTEIEPEPTETRGSFTIKKRGTKISDYTKETINGNERYILSSETQKLGGAYFGVLEEKDDGKMKPISNTLYTTSRIGDTSITFNLNKLQNGQLPLVNVCEVKAPAGYELFSVRGVEQYTDENWGEINCIQLNFEKDKDKIDANGVITKNLPELEDKAKTFTVNVTKSDQDGNKLKDYEFGLFTTKEIKVAGKDAIPANSMVAYGKTDSSGQLKLVDNGYFLPADQNYFLRELNAGNEKTKISVDGTDSYGTEITLNTLEKATVDGYQFNINVVNEIYKTNNVKVIKVDKKTNEKLSGATFNLSDGRDIKSCTTGDDGSCTFENIPYGTYTLNETVAPNGYVLNEEAKTVIVNATTTPITVANLKEANQTFTIKKVITNTPNTTDAFSYTITKVSGDETGYTSSVNAKTETVEGTRKILANATDTYSLTFKKPGTYEFKVKENNEYYKQNETISTANTGKWEMDKTEYNIKLVVSNDMQTTTTINGDEVNNITFTNKYSLGSITLTKSEARKPDKKLSDVEFELIKDGVSLGKAKTNAEGKIIWNDLTYGTYQIKETSTKDGYIKTDEIFTRTINEAKPNDEFNVENYHEAEVNVKINKILSNVASTTDVFDFTVTNLNDNNDKNNTTISVSGGNSSTQKLSFSKAGTYEYTVEEKLAENIKNVWKVKTAPQKIKIVVDNEMNTTLYVNNKKVNNLVLDFENELIIPSTTFTINKKYLYNSQELPNDDVKNLTATFEVKEGETVVGTSSITGNGTAKTPKLIFSELGTKNYTIQEKDMNYPNVKKDDSIHNLSVSVDYKGNGKFEIVKKVDNVVANEVTFNNKVEIANVEINVPINKKLIGESENDLTFTFLINGEEKTVKAKKNPVETVNFVKTLGEGEYEYKITEKNLGEADVTYDSSEYVVKVKIERVGTTFNTSVVYTKDGQNVDEITFVNKYEKPVPPVLVSDPATISIKKEIKEIDSTTDAFEYSIEKISGDDAGFTVDEILSKNQKIKVNDTKNYSFTFKKAGTYEFKVKENNCYYKEGQNNCEVNNGKWTMDSNEYIVKFIVSDDMKVKTLINNKEINNITFINEYSFGSINLIKSDAKNNDLKLANAEFELIKDGVSLGKAETNVKGEITWENLTYGKYQIKETKAPTGYIKNNKTYEVELSKTNKTETVPVKNYHEAEVNIKINKKLKNINETLDKFNFVIANEANTSDANNKAFSIKGAGTYPTVMTFKKAGTYEYTIKEELADNIKNVWKMNTQPQKIKIVVDNEMNVKLFVNNVQVQNQISLDFENELIIPTTTFEINKQYVYKNEKVADEDVKNLISTFEVKESENVVGISSITGNGSANSPELTFNNLNKKVYTVKENKLNNSKIKYDETVYTITVEPKYKGNGEFKFNTQIINKDKTEITFTNEIILSAIKVKMPVTKVLEGESSDYLTFSFTSNNELIQTIKAKKGPIKIDYYKVLGEGEYEYKILEKNLNETGVTYDNSEYIAKVKVKRKGLELKSTVTYTKDGKDANEIIFTNKYKKPEKPTTPVKDSCTSKGPDYFWATDGTCQRRVTNTSTK